MATLSAPYNNAMRLGQGFNSHTQKICIDNAVLLDNGYKKPAAVPAPEVKEPQKQNVTYTARFVDKLSDIVEATNLSPSFAIKSGTIGSPGKGAFIDTDQFKESDINFLIHVKVTNQTMVQQENIRFQRLKNLPVDKFHDVFGDTFISGFLEGGEFTSLISLKVVDRKRKEEVKDQAKIALTSPTASPDAERAAYAARKSLQENTEIAISVNWSGGGELKEEGTLWDIESITKTAARFPDLVYKCPQLTTAVLTKYTAVRSFHETMPGFSPLDYDNVGVYMSDLLDAYMDYKLLSRQINKMIEEPEFYEERAKNESETREDLQPIRLVLSELDEAKTYCRQQMLRIVKEVDTIGAQPELAIEEEHVPPYMSPELFASLIPVRIPNAAAPRPNALTTLRNGTPKP
ncbi:hypothetical protein EDC01DRAFT_463456 [Geopyxis carbonaria]|nr:hypothetical protein EDC01DRAFT_463456 [Geopyxis carbonaria]